MNRPFCAARWRKRREHRKTTLRQWIFFCFFSSKKKRDKRHGGRGRPTEKRRYSAHPIRNEKTDGSRMNRPFCAARWRDRREHGKTTLRQWIFFCFFSSKKKRDKRHGGRGRPTEKRRYSAHPIRNEKTDGSRMNRPFCAARWRDRREHGKTTFRQWIFFCFFSSKKKRRGNRSEKTNQPYTIFRRGKRFFVFERAP